MVNQKLDFENVLPVAAELLQQGVSVCLITNIGIEGVAPRPLGSQMVVGQNGRKFGMLTGGCAEQAITNHAIEMIESEQQNASIRIGSDSPWVDIRLPCGSGIDLQFSVYRSFVEAKWIFDALNLIHSRQVAAVCFDKVAQQWSLALPNHVGLDDSSQIFKRVYLPATQLMIVGAGPYVAALDAMAGQMSFGIEIWSHDADTLSGLRSASTKNLLTSTSTDGWRLDRWTALVVLFHEHEREVVILRAGLASGCFYIGALGSQQTHASRLVELRACGVTEQLLERISGPIGLDISARTPDEIAISILAEIVQVRNKRVLSNTCLGLSHENANVQR